MSARILHVAKVSGISGAERHLLLLLPALRDLGFDVRFVLLHEDEAGAWDFARGLTDAGISVEDVRLARTFSPLAFKRLAAVIRRRRPDLLHTHLVHADFYGLTAGKLARVPVLASTKHGFNAFRDSRLFARGEYYRGQRETAGTDQDLKGFYVVGVFAAVPRLDLVGRYHVFQDRRFPAGDDHMDGVDLGVKYYFDRRDRRSGTFVVATYSIRNADAGVTSGLTLLNDGRGAALENGRDVANALTVRLQVRF